MSLMNKSIEWLENNEGIGCYIHIPFCTNICTYCDFAKMYYRQDWADQYLDALEKEIQQAKMTKNITTLYIGGGTPSSLSTEQLKRLFTVLLPYTDHLLEYTIEVNPESMTYEKLLLFKQMKGTRLSIGVQTFNERILKKIGRQHTNQDVFRLIKQARCVGFEDISIDLMYNLPLQTKGDILADLAVVEGLDITHLSYYSLILEKHTILYNENYNNMDDQEEYEVGGLIQEELKKMGFYQYEVSNYCKQGYPSLHNSLYWLNQHYYGFGLGAHGYLEHCRYQNTKQLSAYQQGKFMLAKEELSLEDEMYESLMVGLRLKQGISLPVFKKRYHVDLLKHYQEVIDKYMKMEMLVIENQHLKTTEKGLDLLDFILLDLIG